MSCLHLPRPAALHHFRLVLCIAAHKLPLSGYLRVRAYYPKVNLGESEGSGAKEKGKKRMQKLEMSEYRLLYKGGERDQGDGYPEPQHTVQATVSTW